LSDKVGVLVVCADDVDISTSIQHREEGTNGYSEDHTELVVPEEVVHDCDEERLETIDFREED